MGGTNYRPTYNTIHDCFVSVIGRKPSNIDIEAIFNRLPKEIHSIANEWGWYDTEVRDKTYLWIQENAELFKEGTE